MPSANNLECSQNVADCICVPSADSAASPSPRPLSRLATAASPGWRHKKFGRRAAKLQAATGPVQGRDPRFPSPLRPSVGPALSDLVLSLGPPAGPASMLSPGREEKKRKRRASDAKWRSNLSVCFKHLERKALRSRKSLKSRLSKEMIVQNTVQKVQYLEAVFMLLHQADQNGTGRTREFSATEGHQQLQSVRKEFANRYHRHKNKDKEPMACKISKSHRPSLTPLQADPIPDGEVPEVGTATVGSCEQLVPPSVLGRADETKGPLADQDVPSTPTVKSLICYEQGLPDEEELPMSPKFSTKNPALDRYCNTGCLPQSRAKLLHAGSHQQVPSISPDWRMFPHASHPSDGRHWPGQLLDQTINKLQRRSSASLPECPQPSSSSSFRPSAAGGPNHQGVGASDTRPCFSPSKTPTRDSATVRRSPPKRARATHGRVESNSSAPGFQFECNPGPILSHQAVGIGNRSQFIHHLVSDSVQAPPANEGSLSAKSARGSWDRGRIDPPITGPAQIHPVSLNEPHLPCTLPCSPVVKAQNRSRADPARHSHHHQVIPMSSPSHRYQINGATISVLEDSDLSEQVVDCVTSLNSSEDGRGTPDLMCQEEIPFWNDEESSPNRKKNFSTPHAKRPHLHHPSKPPPAPTKRQAANWSAKFVSVLKSSHHCPSDQAQGSASASTPASRNKRRKTLFPAEANKSNQYVDDGHVTKIRVRRKYHKRATAARIRPWDPIANKVSSPVYGKSQLGSESKKASIPTPSALSMANPPGSQPRLPHLTVAQMLGRQRRASDHKTSGAEDDGEKEDPDNEDAILDVGSNDFIRCKQPIDLLHSDPISQLADQDNSQGSLLLNEIPQLPEDIITPLLLGGLHDHRFLEDNQSSRRPLFPPRFSEEDGSDNFPAVKSDDDIVLTILQLEESSRSSASTRSSPDSLEIRSGLPCYQALCSGEIAGAVETAPPLGDQREFPDYLLQESLLRQYDDGNAEGDPLAGASCMILSPVRIPRLDRFRDTDLLYEGDGRPACFLLSPIKPASDSVIPESDEATIGKDGGESEPGDGDAISESMARFASCALIRNEISTSDYGHLASDRGRTTALIKDADALSSEEDPIFKGAASTLLNGQLIKGASSSPSAYPQAGPSSVFASPNLIGFGPATPTKEPPCSIIPPSAAATPEYSFIGDGHPGTLMEASQTPPYGLVPPSRTSVHTPIYPRHLLTHLSQSSTFASSTSPELSQESYRLSQSMASPYVKQELLDWTDTGLEDECLDNLLGDNLLDRYYRTYHCQAGGAPGLEKTHPETSRVPDWTTQTSDTSQTSQDSTLLSSLVTSSTVSSQDSTYSDGLLNSRLQVVPTFYASDGGKSE